MKTDNLPLTPRAIIDELKRCHITHIVLLPDTGTRYIYESLQSEGDFTLVPVCREGEAIAVAAGLILGGKKPVVLHQNTGFFESGDSVRGLALGYQLPLLLLISWRGWRRDTPMTDSAAIFIEPNVAAWGIKYYVVDSDENVDRISSAYKEAHETQETVAILIAKEGRSA